MIRRLTQLTVRIVKYSILTVPMSFKDFLNFLVQSPTEVQEMPNICQKISCVPSVCDLKEEYYPEFCIVVE